MKINVVLARPEYASNVGAVARAMANMGADRLILIAPACVLDDKAKEMAAGAQQKLQTVTVYSDWDGFYACEEDGIRLAFSRRAGRKRKVFPLAETLARLADPPPPVLYLIFGPEACGLASSDLASVHFTVHLPVFGDFSSLNLAQAALLALYIVRERFQPARLPSQVKGSVIEPVQKFYFPDQLIRQWLTAMGFDIRARRSSAYLTLRRLLLQNRPSRHEVHVLESILQQNIRKLVGLTAKDVTHDLSDVTVENI